MNYLTIFFISFFLTACGVSTYQHDMRYDGPSNGAYGASSGGYAAAPISPANTWGCDPSFQLELKNRSADHDAVVNIHQLVSDGTSFETAVNVPRRGSRIICLPDIGEYNLEIQLFAINMGAPRLVGCYSRHQSYSAFVGVAGRHEYWIDDFSARGGRC